MLELFLNKFLKYITEFIIRFQVKVYNFGMR